MRTVSNAGRKKNRQKKQRAALNAQKCNLGITPATSTPDSAVANPITPAMNTVMEFMSPTTTLAPCTNSNVDASAKDTIGSNETSTMKSGARRIRKRRKACKSGESASTQIPSPIELNKDEMDKLLKQISKEHDQQNQEDDGVNTVEDDAKTYKDLHMDVMGEVKTDSVSTCARDASLSKSKDDEWYTCLMEKYKDGPYLYAERAYGIKNPLCITDKDLFLFKDEWYTSLMKRYRDDTNPYVERATRIKRPLYIIDQYPGHMESGRVCPRFNFTDPVQVTHYRDNYAAGNSTSFYSRNYYGVDRNARQYPSFQGGNHCFGGGY